LNVTFHSIHVIKKKIIIIYFTGPEILKNIAAESNIPSVEYKSGKNAIVKVGMEIILKNVTFQQLPKS
jgi:hypothetical protein